MLAIMATTYFTPEFHMTLVFGAPFLAALSVLYFARYRRRPHALARAESQPR
ncbi:amino acid transporter [Burkholderia pseudomallei]|nr:amino acid transporter [Burkholderia pseudomallei]CAJ6563244.1 amino acid transporter [Burkholderia pseudomallei]